MGTKKLFASIAGIFLLATAQLSFAADQSLKEDTTLPPAEGGLNVNQIPPLNSAEKLAAKPAPQAPASAPQQVAPAVAPPPSATAPEPASSDNLDGQPQPPAEQTTAPAEQTVNPPQ